ncbi:MAG: DNA-binding protein [Crocinitomicaceae bacterium]|nr:DNA-binding protein [Crocinitomicaceae bacterium]
MENYDVIIVGAGSAGLMSARELGRMGHKVLLLDRKTDLFSFSFNTLGSFIRLEDFDLSQDVVAREIGVIRMYSRRFERKFTYPVKILNKKKVHLELYNALDTNNVKTLTGVYIKEFVQNENGDLVKLIDQNKNEYSGKIVIDASGTIGFLSRKLGLQPQKLEYATGVEYNVRYLGKPDEAHLFIGREFEGGYGWIFPLENDRAIVGFGSNDEKIIKELKSRLDRILAMPAFKNLVAKDNEKCEGGTIPVSEVHTRFVKNNLVCIGDSVSQVNPVVGEGYKFILESAVMAVKAIDEALKQNDNSLLKKYESDWSKRFLDNYNFSKYVQLKMFRYSKYDFLVDFLMIYSRIKDNNKFVKVLAGEYNRIRNKA